MASHNFKVDEKVTVVVRHHSNLLPALFPNRPDTMTYVGTVVRSDGWEPDDTVNMTTGNPGFPVRTVAFQNIISVNGKAFTFTPSQKQGPVEKPKDRVVEVLGSKGDKYLVTIKADGSRKCNCPGFGYRGKCRHTEMTEE